MTNTVMAQTVQFPLTSYVLTTQECDFLEPCSATDSPNDNIVGLHLAEDLKGTAGTPVYAPASGIVRDASVHKQLGFTVLIESTIHGETIVFLLGHLRSVDKQVTTGQTVSRGQLLGYLGTKVGDDRTSPYDNGGWPDHLHFGIHKGAYNNGNACDGEWNYQGYSPEPCAQDDWHDPTDFITKHGINHRAFRKIARKANQLKRTGRITTSLNDSHWYNNDSSTFMIQDWDGGSLGHVAITFDPDRSPAQHRAFAISQGFWAYYSSFSDAPTRFGSPLGNEIGRSYDGINYDPYCRRYHSSGANCITALCGNSTTYSAAQRFQNTTFCWNETTWSVDIPGNRSIQASEVSTTLPTLLLYYPSSGTWYTSKSTGSSLEPATFLMSNWFVQSPTEHWYQPYLADYDGDAMDELLIYTPSGIWFTLHNDTQQWYASQQTFESSFGGPSDTYQAYSGDFNGDTRDDVLLYATFGAFYVRLSSGTGLLWTDLNWLPGAGMQATPETDIRILISDPNGDGLDDVILYQQTHPSAIWSVGLSTGAGFTLSPWLTGLGYQTVNEDWYHPLTGDINGDGFDDIGVATAAGAWYMALSTGNSFTPQTTWYDGIYAQAGDQFFLQDMNGDGMSDAITYTPAAGTWNVGLSTGTHFSPPIQWATDVGTDPTGTLGVHTFFITTP